MADVVEAVSKRRLIVLVGAAGCGKRSAIVQACKNANLVYRQKLVDPSKITVKDIPSDPTAFVVNNLLFNTIDDVDKYVHQIKLRLFPRKNVITFLPLSIGNYKDIVLKHLLDQLRYIITFQTHLILL